MIDSVGMTDRNFVGPRRARLDPVPKRVGYAVAIIRMNAGKKGWQIPRRVLPCLGRGCAKSRGKARGLDIKAIDELAPAIGRDRPYHARNVIKSFEFGWYTRRIFPTRPVRDPSPLKFIAVAAFSAPQLARFSAHAHTRYFYVSAQIPFLRQL
jgi:hypothetical protein